MFKVLLFGFMILSVMSNKSYADKKLALYFNTSTWCLITNPYDIMGFTCQTFQAGLNLRVSNSIRLNLSRSNYLRYYNLKRHSDTLRENNSDSYTPIGVGVILDTTKIDVLSFKFNLLKGEFFTTKSLNSNVEPQIKTELFRKDLHALEASLFCDNPDQNFIIGLGCQIGVVSSVDAGKKFNYFFITLGGVIKLF